MPRGSRGPSLVKLFTNRGSDFDRLGPPCTPPLLETEKGTFPSETPRRAFYREGTQEAHFPRGELPREWKGTKLVFQVQTFTGVSDFRKIRKGEVSPERAFYSVSERRPEGKDVFSHLRREKGSAPETQKTDGIPFPKGGGSLGRLQTSWTWIATQNAGVRTESQSRWIRRREISDVFAALNGFRVSKGVLKMYPQNLRTATLTEPAYVPEKSNFRVWIFRTSSKASVKGVGTDLIRLPMSLLDEN